MLGLYACTDYDDALPAADAGPDAITTADSAPAIDSGGGGSLEDVTTTALVDAGVDAASGSNCKSALFCWDFEGSEGPPNYGWTASYKVPATGTVLAVEGSTNAGHHLHVKAVAGSPITEPGVSLLWDLPPTIILADGKRIRLDLDFNVASADTYGVIAGLQFGTGQDRFEYGLALNSGSGGLGGIVGSENDRSDKPGAGALNITANAALHATVILTRAGNTIGGTVRVGSSLVNARAQGAMPDGLFGPIGIIAGDLYVGDKGTAADLTIDNVLVTMP